MRPTFGGVEANDPNRVLILSFEHVHDDGLEVCPLDIRFAIGPTVSAKVIHDDIDVLIVAIRHDRRRSAGFAPHTNPDTT